MNILHYTKWGSLMNNNFIIGKVDKQTIMFKINFTFSSIQEIWLVYLINVRKKIQSKENNFFSYSHIHVVYLEYNFV